MIYFLKNSIKNSNSDIVENAIRRFSVKRYTSLDLQKSYFNISEDKYFLGLEGSDDLKITRIRTPFESFFPKVIVSFSKNKGFEMYKIRFSLLSTFVFAILFLGVIQSVFLQIEEKKFSYDFLFLTMIFIIFLGFSFAEIELTRFKIKKAIFNFVKTSVGKIDEK